MGKSKRNQDFAEDMDFSQSADMEVETLRDTTSDDLKAVVKELSADVKAVTKYSETLGLAIDGIGRFLLNEDGSTRDFTNKELMDKTAKKVDAGLKQMNANAENIGTKIGQIPQTIPAELSVDSKFWIAKVSDNAKLAIIVFVLFFVITAFVLGVFRFLPGGFDDNYYKDLIITYLAQHGKKGRAEINELLLDKLPDALTEKQKHIKVGNLLLALRRSGIIEIGEKKQWTLKSSHK